MPVVLGDEMEKGWWLSNKGENYYIYLLANFGGYGWTSDYPSMSLLMMGVTVNGTIFTKASCKDAELSHSILLCMFVDVSV